MKNYIYIVASLPCISADYKFDADSADTITDDIVDLLDEKDAELVRKVQAGVRAENIDADFYKEALASPVRFVREYFLFDMLLRNEKVKYLNAKFSRDPLKDIMVLDPDADAPDFEQAQEVGEALALGDLLEKEKALDDIMSRKIDTLTVFDYFDIDVILGFIAKLNIYTRWARLDKEAGKAKFKAIVDELISKANF